MALISHYRVSAFIMRALASYLANGRERLVERWYNRGRTTK